MTHFMNLHHAPFTAIRSGRKTVEMRLHDEKRALIKVGDSIVFTDSDTKETLVCVVVNVYRYASFKELYARHDKISIGYTEDEEAKPEDMLAYYPQGKIEKYGVVGIEIKVIR